MLEKLFKPFKKRFNKPILLERASIHDNIGALSVREVKRILTDEDFGELNSLYFLMLQRDLHLSSQINKRKMQILSIDYNVEGSDKAVKFIQSYIEKIDFNILLQELTGSLPYGFSFIDLIWNPLDIENSTYFLPTSFKHLSPRFVYADNEGQKYLKDTIEHLYIMQKSEKKYIRDFDYRKLLVHIHKTDIGFITDFALLNKVAWFVTLKHSVISANMQYYDALGTPPLIVNRDSDDEDELQFILSQALSLRSNSIGVFPKDSAVSLLEGKGSKSDFLSFIKYIDSSISEYILGNTLAGGDGSSGTYGTAKIHQEIKEEYLKFDAKLISKTITNFFNLVLSQNLPNEEVSFKFVFEDIEDKKELSVTYKNLTEAGYVIPVEHIEKKFQIKGVTKLSTKTEPNHIEHNKKQSKKPLDHIDSQFLKLNTKEIEEKIMGPLITLLEKSESYQEAYEKLVEKYPDIDINSLEESLSKLIANAYIQGSVDVDQDQL